MEARLKRSLISTFVAAALFGSQLPAQEQPKLVESVEVRVINIDVVVTDKKGNPIKGLKADDFNIFENGKPQAITNFAEINAAATVTTTETTPAPAPAPTPAPAAETVPASQRRMVVFYVDNLSLKPFNRNRVFQSMKTFAKEVLRPGDQAMIATWNRSMKIRVPFTSDPITIQQTLESLAGESALGVQNTSDRRSVEQQIRDSRSYSEAVATARQYAQQVDHDLRQSVQAINGLMATLAGVEGKKVLVLTSEGFPMQPGREMFEYLDEIKRERTNWGQSGSSIIEGMSFNARNQLQSVARAANANGITLYALHAGGLGATMDSGAEHRVALPMNVQQAAVTNSTDSLQLLAELTGGRAAVGTNNFRDAFARIVRDLESYYSIGYRSATGRIDRSRNVDVRPKNRAYQVRARKSFVEKSLGTEMTDRVVANLFYPTKTNDLRILVVTGKPVQLESDRFKIPVDIRIPMTALTFLPQGETFAGGFTVYVGVSNKFGDMSDINQKNHRMTLRAEELKDIEGRYFTYNLELVVEKGRNKISIGVVDDVSHETGFDLREIIAADLN